MNKMAASVAGSSVSSAAKLRSADRTWSVDEMTQRMSTALSEWITAGMACASGLQGPMKGSPHEEEFTTGCDRFLQMSGVSLVRAQALDRLLSMMVRTPAGRIGAVDDETYIESSMRLQSARETFYEQRNHLQETLYEQMVVEARRQTGSSMHGTEAPSDEPLAGHTP